MSNELPGSVSRRRASVVQDKQSYKNIGYLLCSFFLSLCYFALIVSGICVGIATLFVGIGVLILFATVWLWWQFAAFEHFLAINWLGVSIAPMNIADPAFGSWWQYFQTRLSTPMTWKILFYLLLKFPLSTCCFVCAVVLPIISLCLTIVGGVLGLVTAPIFALIGALRSVPDPGKRLRDYLVLSLSAFRLNRAYLSLLNGMAWMHGQLAHALLGMSDTALRLEEAKAQAEQEHRRAEQAEQRRHELVANVSHELRAPVANIAGHLESLLLTTEENTQPPSPESMHNYLEIAYQEARRLGQLVDELLSLANMESHELSLDIREIAANEVIEEVYQMLMPLAQRERQVTLVRGSQPHLPLVLADRQRLVQVLQNLVRNAITYTPAGGIVSITLEVADEQHLALVVEDNGIGIPSDELEHVFERFYRIDASRSRATGGFGLGLAIVHDLVTAMGGSIDVSSPVGQGSRFRVLLRVSPKDSNSTSQSI